jgi:hypothetical protein
MEPSQVATMVISIAFGLVTFCWLATARANQRRHEDTVLLTYAAAWQPGDEQDLLVLGPVRRLVEERERKERALGSTSKSILGAAVPAVVGSGDPPAMNQDDKEDESEAEAGRGSFQPTPASHRGRSSRRPSPTKPTAMPQVEVSPHSPLLDGCSRGSIDLQRRVQQGLVGETESSLNR